MTTCIRCNRPLKQPTETGMGRVCAAKFAPAVLPAEERTLFGYDTEKAMLSAQQRGAFLAAALVAAGHAAVRAQFRGALARLDAIRSEPVVWTGP